MISRNNVAYADDWGDPWPYCYWGICLDLNWDNIVNEADFLVVVGSSGAFSGPCLDGPFSDDGYADEDDAESWDWTLNLTNRLNLCGHLPLYWSESGFATGGFGRFGGSRKLLNLSDLNDLLIAGKRGTTDGQTKLKDRLYVFDSNAHYIRWFEPEPNRCNIRVVRGVGDDLYQINSENGISRLDQANTQVVPPGEIVYDANEPRYNLPAMIYVGIQGTGENSFGRPIFDAAFDATFVYVVPVVVVPDGNEPYTAAAKLVLDPCSTPPYHVVKLYDGPILPCDGNGQYRNTLREIELDTAGNVYVTNAHIMNESDILWKFEPNGSVRRLYLGDPNGQLFVRAPTGMCVSSATNVLYLTSSQCGREPNEVVIYGLSTETLAPVRTITVSRMQHVTSITEDPITNSLWISGFSFNSLLPPSPWEVNPYDLPFYDPYLASVPLGVNDVSAVCILDANDPNNDLAMPLSIVWTGALPTPEPCGEADLNKDGKVSMQDLAILARHWLDINCDPENNYCEGADFDTDTNVDYNDLRFVVDCWLW